LASGEGLEFLHDRMVMKIMFWEMLIIAQWESRHRIIAQLKVSEKGRDLR
jgi:hypothetical protein